MHLLPITFIICFSPERDLLLSLLESHRDAISDQTSLGVIRKKAKRRE
jgi:hypothetical protein